MTPTQHRAQAESTLSSATGPNRIVDAPTWLLVQAHGLLAKATATDPHYEPAEAAIAAAETQSAGSAHRHEQAHLALAHAQLLGLS